MWYALFSQSGTEIVEISKKLGRWPDIIFTNNKDKYGVHKELMHRSSVRRNTHNKIVADIENEASMWGAPLITLHGYLRIMPDLPFEMYNGHPGDIVTYPMLKGKDPQKKALDLNLSTTGCVIHKVTPELDGGPIIKRQVYSITRDETELTLINNLRTLSIDMWVEFLKEKLD